MPKRRVGALAVAAFTAFGALASASTASVSAPSEAVHAAGAAGVGRARLPKVRLTQIATVTAGTALAFRRDDPTLYVARQSGDVVAVRDGVVDPTPVLRLGPRVTSGGEQGLLGLAFSPDGARLYVHFSGRRGETVLEVYSVVGAPSTPARVDVATRRTLLTVDQPQSNHNGGQLSFGPDGKLYLGLGDGGGAGDEGAGHAEGGNAQSRQTLLGKILRIEPTPAGSDYTIPTDNPFARGGGRPEIWVYGLRNPWRFSFDRKTGDLWIADVGQDRWEEIDRLRPHRQAGANLGWNLLEGAHAFRAESARGTVPPLVELSHSDGNCSITGGYVYRGSRLDTLRGRYLFTDFCRDGIRAIRVRANGSVRLDELGIGAPRVASFGEDAAGELYVVSQTNGVFRIDPA